jgi:hypothetical protein
MSQSRVFIGFCKSAEPGAYGFGSSFRDLGKSTNLVSHLARLLGG